MQKNILMTRTERGVVRLTVNDKGRYTIRNLDKKLLGHAWLDPKHGLWVHNKGKKAYTTLRGAVVALQGLAA